MATGSTARKPAGRQLAYMMKEIHYNTTGIGTGVVLGKLPKGARIHSCVVNVETAFNASGTNRLVIGTNSTSFNNSANTTDIQEGTVGGYAAYRGGALAFTADTDVKIKYTSATGTAASTGKAVVILAYAPESADLD